MKLINIINIILISLVCQSLPSTSVVIMFVLTNVKIFKWIQRFALKICFPLAAVKDHRRPRLQPTVRTAQVGLFYSFFFL